MTLLMRKMALLAKSEVTYNVDSVPTGIANAMQVRNVRVNPLTVESESRDLARPSWATTTPSSAPFTAASSLRWKPQAQA